MINLDGKTFVSIENSNNGEVSGETIFHYHQNDNIVWAEYSGGSIITGHLYAIMNDDSSLNMKYHHINILNSIMSGNCTSFPKFLEKDTNLTLGSSCENCFIISKVLSLLPSFINRSS